VRVRVEADEVLVSGEARARVARALRLALERFRPRVAGATLRIRRGEGNGAKAIVRVAVPLGPAGVVRVSARDVDPSACTGIAIERAASAVDERLRAERRELLEFLFLAGRGAGGWPRRRGRAQPARTRSA
jgi:hypothetical protein